MGGSENPLGEEVVEDRSKKIPEPQEEAKGTGGEISQTGQRDDGSAIFRRIFLPDHW